MRRYPNEHGISRMEFTVPVTPFCPLGPNYYRATVECVVELDGYIIDFLDLEEYFKVKLNGAKLTTEALASEVYETLMREYLPLSVVVRVHSDSHFPITTEKRSN